MTKPPPSRPGSPRPNGSWLLTGAQLVELPPQRGAASRTGTFTPSTKVGELRAYRRPQAPARPAYRPPRDRDPLLMAITTAPAPDDPSAPTAARCRHRHAKVLAAAGGPAYEAPATRQE